ncbi:MAG: ribonuclease E activity regulator RraA [Formosimonas sp.]
MSYLTADLCDQYEAQIHAGHIRVLPAVFNAYTKVERFHGQVVTLKVFEDNSLIKQVVENENGAGKVLVIDAGASLRCAVLGGNLAQAAVNNGWAGVVIDGVVRDTLELKPLSVGILALGAHPLRAVKRNTGERDIPVHIQGVGVYPNDYIYADSDGILLSAQPL